MTWMQIMLVIMMCVDRVSLGCVRQVVHIWRDANSPAKFSAVLDETKFELLVGLDILTGVRSLADSCTADRANLHSCVTP